VSLAPSVRPTNLHRFSSAAALRFDAPAKNSRVNVGTLLGGVPAFGDLRQTKPLSENSLREDDP
jgi:hypothetical protein